MPFTDSRIDSDLIEGIRAWVGSYERGRITRDELELELSDEFRQSIRRNPLPTDLIEQKGTSTMGAIVVTRDTLTLQVASETQSLYPCTPRNGATCPRTVAFVVYDGTNPNPEWMGCPHHIRQAGWFVGYEALSPKKCWRCDETHPGPCEV